MNLTGTDKPKNIDQLVAALTKDQRVVFAYLFGSYASGKQNSLSDVDVAVFLHPDSLTADTKLELIGLLSDKLCSDGFDLVILNTAPSSLVGRILQHRKLLVDKQPYTRHSFESLNLRKFFDFSYLERNLLERRFNGDRQVITAA